MNAHAAEELRMRFHLNASAALPDISLVRWIALTMPSGQKSVTVLNMAELRCSAPVQFDSIVDGEGLRAVVWTQGCPHGCPGCHNPQTHAFDGGTLMLAETIADQLKAHFYLDGVTFSGGEPMMQAAVCALLAEEIHKLGMNVWCYTGYQWETLLEKRDPDQMAFLKQIDVLIDGRFVQAQADPQLHWRGSANQRVIDVPRTLAANSIVLHDDK